MSKDGVGQETYPPGEFPKFLTAKVYHLRFVHALCHSWKDRHQGQEYWLGSRMFGAFGNTDHEYCIRLVHKAIDAGVNFTDSAGFYAGGGSEEIVGKALNERRDGMILSTKFSTSVGGERTSAGGARWQIINAIEASLKRLNTDHIDVVQVAR
jgi:aryl-alcohol dehydrogenase-like predicted oxidoreductase